MEEFKLAKGSGLVSIVLNAFLCNIFVIFITYFINSYEVAELLKISIIGLNLYLIYYIFIYTTTKYYVDKDNFYITSIFGIKKNIIPIKSIECYKTYSGTIKSIRISGLSGKYYAIGRNMMNKIGNTYMYVTSSRNIIYLKTDKINYGISPKDYNKFKQILDYRNIKEQDFEIKINKDSHILKDKRYYIPFGLVAIITVIMVLIPMVLYLQQKLPSKMPLIFDAKFKPMSFGTGKQFAFKQAIYGALNMVILICMYYVSYFYYKYDKDYAYKFIYIPLIIVVTFFIMQIKILTTFL